MGCQEILIGGKEKEEERHYACFEEKKKNWEKRKTKRILHAEAILVAL